MLRKQERPAGIAGPVIEAGGTCPNGCDAVQSPRWKPCGCPTGKQANSWSAGHRRFVCYGCGLNYAPGCEWPDTD